MNNFNNNMMMPNEPNMVMPGETNMVMPNENMVMPNENMVMPEYKKEMSMEEEGRMVAGAVYPELFYKLQPYIMMVCDQAEARGIEMPSQEMVESITDAIHDDMVKTYPDVAEYVRNQELYPNRATSLAVQGPFFQRRGARRRGLFRDLIDILLLAEFGRRRRRRRQFFDFY